MEGNCYGFRLATLASDSFGLSSFHANNIPQRMYRCLVFVSVAFGHFVLVNAGGYGYGTMTFLYSARFWCLFASSVTVLLLQFIREDAIRKCHRYCEKLPSVPAFRSVFLHFALFFFNVIIYHVFYRAVFIKILFYALVLFFIVQLPSIQFGYLMSSVRQGIRAVNQKLEDFLKENNGEELSGRDSEKNMSGIHEEYMALTVLAEHLVSVYSYQLVVMLAQCSLEVLFLLQIAFFDAFTGNRIINRNLDFTLKTYILLSYIYKLCDVITPGENYLEEVRYRLRKSHTYVTNNNKSYRTVTQCKRTNEMLCKIKNVGNGENSEVREFILQRILEPSTLSVLGLFQLDYRLLYTIGCGAINYGLIIGMFYLGGHENDKKSFL